SSPDYATLTDAVNDLNSNGVSGPVTFNIRSGTYPEKVSIDKFSGASAVNRVTFKSETNNPADVLIQSSSSSTTDNYVIKLNSAEYVTLRSLTIENTGSGTYTACVNLAGTASYD